MSWARFKLRFRAFINDCLLGRNDYCNGCKYTYLDQYGRMCEHPRREEKDAQILIRDRVTFKTLCNLWEPEKWGS